MLVTAIILAFAAVLLISAVVFGFLRNHRTRGLANVAANADIPGQRR